jgi:hypothetical protein
LQSDLISVGLAIKILFAFLFSLVFAISATRLSLFVWSLYAYEHWVRTNNRTIYCYFLRPARGGLAFCVLGAGLLTVRFITLQTVRNFESAMLQSCVQYCKWYLEMNLHRSSSIFFFFLITNHTHYLSKFILS